MLRRLFAIIFSIVLSGSFLAVGWVSSKEGSASAVQADFYVTPIAGPPPLTVQFLNQSTGADTCLWDLGEEIIETCEDVSHVYTINGSYTISLTISSDGEEDTLIREDYVIVDDQLPESVLPAWENMGIYGGGARDGVVEPDTDRICISGGGWPYFYCSENFGENWEGVGPGFGAGGTLELLSDGPNYVYYGLFEAAVYSSTNRGNDWGMIVDAPKLNNEAYPTSFDINKNNPDHLVITASEYGPDEPSTIYYTQNGGDSWPQSSFLDPFPGKFIDVAIDPTDSGLDVYAVSGREWGDFNVYSHIYKSTDAGASFLQVFTPTLGTQMSVVAVNHHGVIYAGSSQGLYRSPTGDKGTWELVLDSGSWVNFIEFETVDQDSVFIDGYWSENGIDSWQPISLSAFVAQSTIDPNMIFTTSGIGIKRNIAAAGDWEETGWEDVNTGIEGITISDTVNDPNDLDIIYISPFGRSDDGGANWIYPAGDLTFASNSLAVDPEVSGRVYAGDDTFFYWSENFGQNWYTYTINAPSAGAIEDIAVNPLNGENILIGMSGYDSELVEAVGGLSYSTNRGADWNHTELDLPINAVEIGETSDGLMFYAGAGDHLDVSAGRGVYTSTDGMSWSPAGLSDKMINALAVDPNDGETIYAGSYTGSWPIGEIQPLYKSTEKGKNWVQLSLEAPGCENVDEIAVDPNNSDMVIVSVCELIYFSIDGGLEWHLYHEGRPNEQFQSIYIPNQNTSTSSPVSTNASSPSTVYLATSQGLYRRYELYPDQYEVLLPMVSR